MNWVCDDAWKGPFTQSAAFLGAVVGALVFGSMADYLGRYPTFVVTNAVLFISGIVTPFCTDFYSFVLVRFVMGTTFYTFYTLIYVLGEVHCMGVYRWSNDSRWLLFGARLTWLGTTSTMDLWPRYQNKLLAALEYVSVERRSLISNLGLAVGLTVGGAVEPWILKALGDWKIFHVILFAQAAVVVVTPL